MQTGYIVVQAGGKGTRMEHLTRNKPKALVPVNNLPILFHLFQQFPDKKFIIIGDYKFDVLEKYLKAFAKVSYSLIDAHGKKGTNGGLMDAVSLVPEGNPFMLIWSDLILPKDFQLPEKAANYVGVAKDFRCRWKFEQNQFKEEASDSSGVAGLFLFQDKSFLKNVPAEGEFVRWLKDCNFLFEEMPVWHTKEYGLYSVYWKLPVRRCRPFNRLTIEGDCVIKEAVDSRGKELAKHECAWYKALESAHFQNLPKIFSFSPLRMEKIEGKNVYEYPDLPIRQKREILDQIIECLKEVQSLDQTKADRESYEEAYIGKTFARLETVRDLVPFANDPVICINGKQCRNVFFYREKLQQMVDEYIPEQFKLIHGDCTFSNILLREDGTPVLIDPRGYFGFTELYGDPAYDWAKLYYSIMGDYDQFNLKRFRLSINEKDVELKIETNGWREMEPYFFQKLKGNVEEKQIRLLHAIIWLSLTTYAWEDYDSICGAFYNGLYYLEDLL
jgi:GTP:adenosylcobinamide-phosphate guanylyltransferase/thiamine kinase-like enzyme